MAITVLYKTLVDVMCLELRNPKCMIVNNSLNLVSSCKIPVLPIYGNLSDHTTNVTGFAKRGLIHASDFVTLMRHNFICGSAMKLKFTVSLV